MSIVHRIEKRIQDEFNQMSLQENMAQFSNNDIHDQNNSEKEADPNENMNEHSFNSSVYNDNISLSSAMGDGEDIGEPHDNNIAFNSRLFFQSGPQPNFHNQHDRIYNTRPMRVSSELEARQNAAQAYPELPGRFPGENVVPPGFARYRVSPTHPHSFIDSQGTAINFAPGTVALAALGPSSNHGDNSSGLPIQTDIKYKTELCKRFLNTGSCRYQNACSFAHGPSELRRVVIHPKYKSELCRNFHLYGFCKYGQKCNFIHKEEERSLNTDNPGNSSDVEVNINAPVNANSSHLEAKFNPRSSRSQESPAQLSYDSISNQGATSNPNNMPRANDMELRVDSLMPNHEVSDAGNTDNLYASNPDELNTPVNVYGRKQMITTLLSSLHLQSPIESSINTNKKFGNTFYNTQAHNSINSEKSAQPNQRKSKNKSLKKNQSSEKPTEALNVNKKTSNQATVTRSSNSGNNNKKLSKKM